MQRLVSYNSATTKRVTSLYSVSQKKVPYNNRIITIEGTFWGTHCTSAVCIVTLRHCIGIYMCTLQEQGSYIEFLFASTILYSYND